MAEENEGADVAAGADEGAGAAAPGAGDRSEPDYKALYEKTLAASRKWEERSKANAEKARAYDERDAQARTVEERLTALETENADLKARAERGALVKAVAASTGVPEGVVAALSGTDEDALTEQAKAVAAAMRPKGGSARIPEAGHLEHGAAKPTKESILKIKSGAERVRAMGAHPELFRR